MRDPIITLTDVSKQFRHKRPLKDLNLTLHRNKVYGFSGPNGSGKTLTFKVILGFVRPTTGTVIVNGEVIRQDRLFAANVGFALPEYGPLDAKTGQENLELLALLADFPKARIPALLQYVGLEPQNPQRVRDYSLGMRQRLLIAIALIGDAEVIILDEPTNALDEAGQAFLVDLIADLKRQGKTILVSSHDSGFLKRVSDHMFYYSEGTIVREEAR
ncbi:ATP-binding cassette domain-containing protein [Lacticaseibacillus absianus]|uniref:ATP-binding cassette domain-containing protein n=1 Tax=Lacticaseibacillus absianus TaxID=2729623 RepID=UPI0015C752D1|nr:ATP-binding cassette domain-containing protein [Lacticaseibacillus absianus]